MTITTVFFDLDDTLHDHLRPFASALSNLDPAKHFDPEAVYKRFRHHSDLLWNDYSVGKLSLQSLREQRIILGLKDFNVNLSLEEAKHFQKNYDLENTRLQLFPEACEVITRLKDAGYHIGILSNGPTDHQMNKIKQLGLTKLVATDRIFISDAVGYAKPDGRIFDYVSKHVNTPPDELLYIGDSWRPDIQGAVNAGWQAIWYNHRGRAPESDHKPIQVITNLKEILLILL